MMSVNNSKLVFWICLLSSLLFLFTHIVYLVFFAIIGVKQLIIINIASVSFYFIMLLLIRFKLYNLYVVLVANEIAIYMLIATIIIGLDAGFHLCYIGLCTLIYFAGYFSQFGKKLIKPIYFALYYTALFFFVYIWMKFNKPIHPIESVFSTTLYIAHSIIIFGCVIAALAILTHYAIKLECRILKESETDRLTNVYNRNGLLNYYNRINGQEANYIIGIFDIDNFKKFNDVNGHLCGDYILQEVARIAKENSADDFVSRWGGEEFVIISKIDNDIEDTYNKIDRIRKTINDYNFKYNSKSLKTTITIGVAQFDNDESLDSWIKRADKKLYKGKQNGKNQIVK